MAAIVNGKVVCGGLSLVVTWRGVVNSEVVFGRLLIAVMWRGALSTVTSWSFRTQPISFEGGAQG